MINLSILLHPSFGDALIEAHLRTRFLLIVFNCTYGWNEELEVGGRVIRKDMVEELLNNFCRGKAKM